jgi:hypothetical protein
MDNFLLINDRDCLHGRRQHTFGEEGVTMKKLFSITMTGLALAGMTSLGLAKQYGTDDRSHGDGTKHVSDGQAFKDKNYVRILNDQSAGYLSKDQQTLILRELSVKDGMHSPVSVPEVPSLFLLPLGLVGLIVWLWKRRGQGTLHP